MKFRHALVIPVTAALIAATAFAASAAVVVPPTPFATLPAGSGPVDVVTDAAHNVYVLSRSAAPSTVTEFSPAGALVHTYSFPLSSGSVVDLTIDANGMIYTANSGDHTIGLINTVSQTLNASWADVGPGHIPSVVQYDDARGVLYTGDETDGLIFRIGSGGGTVGFYTVLSLFGSTTGLTILPNGNIAVSWNDIATVGHIGLIQPRPAPAPPIATGNYVSTGAGVLTSGIDADSAGHLYVTNTNANNLMEFDSNAGGALMNTFALPAGSDPVRLAVDSSDNVYFSASNSLTGESSIGFISAAGDLTASIATLPLNTNPAGLTVDSAEATLTTVGFRNDTVVQLALGATITSPDPSATFAAGAAFNYTPTTSGLDPITFSSPNLPAGFMLDAATGAVTGAAGAAGSTIAFDLVPSNTFGAGTAQHIVITVAAAPPTPTPTPTPTSGTGGSGSGGGASTATSSAHLPTVAG